MSTSNTSSPMDQNVFDPQAAAQARDRRKKVIEKSLAKRHRKEKSFPYCWFISSGYWPCIRSATVW